MNHFESSSKSVDNYFLSSEPKNLGGGSGQQIVTAVTSPTDTKTLWWIRGPNQPRDGYSNACQTSGPGEQIKCGDIIRLTHVNTLMNLHSHEVKSVLSRQQEVSAYGEGDGSGDGGDDWKVVCKGTYWMREQIVEFEHVDTGKYLGASSTVKFTPQNCGHNCPIMNHLEVFGRSSRDMYAQFVVEMGVHLSV